MSPAPCPDRVQFVTDFIDHNLEPYTLEVYMGLSLLCAVTALLYMVILNRLEKSLSEFLWLIQLNNLILGLCSAAMAAVLYFCPESVLLRNIFYCRWCLSSLCLASSAYIITLTAIVGVWRLGEVVLPIEYLSPSNARVVSLSSAPFCFFLVLVLDVLGLVWMPSTHDLCDESELVSSAPYLYAVNTGYEDYWAGLFEYFFRLIPTGCSLLANALLIGALIVKSRSVQDQDKSQRTGLALPLLMLGFLAVHVLPGAIQLLIPQVVTMTSFPWKYIVFHGNMLPVTFNVLSFPVFFVIHRGGLLRGNKS